jgi:hypothetical protein
MPLRQCRRDVGSAWDDFEKMIQKGQERFCKYGAAGPSKIAIHPDADDAA